MRKLLVLAALAVVGCGTTTSHTLTVQKSGTGAGTVSGSGIECGATCSKLMAAGTTVTLTAIPELGSVVGAWTGCESSTMSTCTVTMSADRTVGVTFTVAQVVLVSSDITTPTTWQTGNLYQVTKGIRVTAALTIQPGVVVKFDAKAALTVSGTGSISADGQNATTPIIFTSSAMSPAAGDWGGITLSAGSSVFGSCQFLYAGANEDAALTVGSGATARVTNCTFAHHRTATDTIDAAPALDASQAAAGTVIKDNLFFDNREPLSVNVTFSVEPNTFDNRAAAPQNPQPNKYNAVIVRGCGHITSTIVWPALTVPYVIGDSRTACRYVNVDAAGQLTIGPNAVVKFFADGSLMVNGTVTARAVFTSIKDDVRGGDTNGDALATTPAPADWNGVTVAKNGSLFDQCSFLYAGSSNEPALNLRTTVTTVTNSIFAHHHPAETRVVAAPALDASEAASATVITGNTFFDNTVPLSWNTTSSINDSNTFSGAEPGGVTMGNTYQAIIVRGCGHVAADLNWAATKVPLLIGDPVSACNYVQIDSTAHVTMADGVVVKFFPGGSMTVNGVLTANATSGITFTAWADDAHGGDTNADGTASMPAGGAWAGIRVSNSGSTFNHCNFLYGGGATTGGDEAVLSVNGEKAISVTNSVFAHIRTRVDSLRATPALDVSEAAPVGTVLTNNRIFDSTLPLGINVRLSLDDSNAFASGDTAAPLPNKYNGIVVVGCGHVPSSTQWTTTQVPFIVGNAVDACNYLVIDGAGHLTLGPGVTLKFFARGRIEVAIGGALTLDPSVWLTGIADDRVNDTNADGTATSPAAGDWNGVKYAHQGTAPTCDESAYMHWYTPNRADHSCSW